MSLKKTTEAIQCGSLWAKDEKGVEKENWSTLELKSLSLL